MTDTIVPLADEYLEAAETIRANAAVRKALDASDEAAKEIIRKHLAEGDIGVDPATGEALVKVKPGARVFNETEARKNWPADVLARVTRVVTEEKIDKTLAQDILPPAVYDLGCKQNKPSVVTA